MLGRFDQRFDHGAVGRGGAEDQVGHDGVERGARGLAALAAFELRVDLELDRLQDRDGDLRKQPAAHLRAFQPAEDRRFRPVDAHRHHHRVRLVGDHRRAVIDLHQAAGDGDAAFRKDHQRIAVAHRIDDVAQRERLERIERHGAHEFEERLDPPVFRHRHVDGEDRALRQDRHRQRRIEEADMVERDDGVGAGLGDVLQAFDLEPEEGAEHDREKIVQPAGRHGAADGDGDQRDWRRRSARTKAACRSRTFAARARTIAPTTMKAALSTLTAGDDAGAAIGAGPDLHRGEHRHDEQAAGDREAGEIDRDVNAVAARQKTRRCVSGLVAGTTADAVQPRSSANRPSSTVATSVGNSTMRPAASQAARPEPTATDTEKMVRNSGDDLLAAADVVRHQRRQQRQDQRADQPEPARHDRAPPQPRIGAQLLDERAGRRKDVAVDGEVGRAFARSAE